MSSAIEQPVQRGRILEIRIPDADSSESISSLTSSFRTEVARTLERGPRKALATAMYDLGCLAGATWVLGMVLCLQGRPGPFDLLVAKERVEAHSERKARKIQSEKARLGGKGRQAQRRKDTEARNKRLIGLAKAYKKQNHELSARAIASLVAEYEREHGRKLSWSQTYKIIRPALTG